mgnify:CR=1 FL=1
MEELSLDYRRYGFYGFYVFFLNPDHPALRAPLLGRRGIFGCKPVKLPWKWNWEGSDTTGDAQSTDAGIQKSLSKCTRDRL